MEVLKVSKIQIKRAYVENDPSDGKRVLVDRMWPRGVKKETLAVDLWEKSIAPTSDLRKKFGHDPQKFDWFKKEYIKELNQEEETETFVKQIKQWVKEDENVTLVYGAKDEKHNQAVVLKEYLEKKL